MKKAIACILVLMLSLSVMATGADAEIKSDDFVPVVGEWTYNEESKTVIGGNGSIGDNYAGSGMFIEPGQNAVVTVDVRITDYVSGCGAGLFFDPMGEDERYGVGSGMGVLTWLGSDFNQFKTWCWNPVDIGTYGDCWNPVENFTYGDTETVYMIKVEFTADEKIECTLINKTTGDEHVLEDGPLDLNNSDGVYVGLMSLNCKAEFSDFTFSAEEPAVVTEDREDTSAESEDTAAQTEPEDTAVQTEPEGRTSSTVEPDGPKESEKKSGSTDNNAGEEQKNVLPFVLGAVVALAVIVAVILVINKNKKQRGN